MNEPFWQSGGVSIYCGDCLEVMPSLNGPVDMILADLPYGSTACSWDTRIPFEQLWDQYRKIIKPFGAIVLFGSQPFTSALVMSNPKWFRYEWIWEKPPGYHTGFANAAYAPMKAHESILVFSPGRIRSNQFVSDHVTYNPQGTQRVATARAGCIRKKSACFSARGQSGAPYVPKATNYPVSVVRFAGVRNALHPTQKPTPLLEYLIHTYTNPGELVLDNTMGSGSTGVACVNSGRRFIGIELLQEFCEVSSRRIEDALVQPRLILDTSSEDGEASARGTRFSREQSETRSGGYRDQACA